MSKTAFPSLETLIDTITAKTPLSEIIGKDIRLIRKGHEFLGLCPFHNEKTPSFTINDQKKFYHCFGCGAHGNMINYVMEQRNVPFKEALEILSAETGVPLPAFSKSFTAENLAESNQKKKLLNVMKLATELFQKTLKTETVAQEARQYLITRGISPESIEQFKIGFCEEGVVQRLQREEIPLNLIEEAGIASALGKGRFAKRIIFPIIGLDGNIIAFGGRVLKNLDPKYPIPKYLNSPETTLFHKGSCLYNLFSAREYSKRTPLIVVEGYLDAISMVQYGFPQTVASLGTALTELHIATLWRYSDHPILCFDGDEAGFKASIRAATRVLPLLKPGKTLLFCYLPDGLDPDDFLRKKGKAAMQALLTQAKPLAEVLWNGTIDRYLKKDGLSNFTMLPEEQVALKKELIEMAATIENTEIQLSYKTLFLDRFFAFIQKIRQQNASDFKKNPFQKNQHSQVKSTSRVRLEEISQKILLGILLKTPILLEELDEPLSKIVFENPELQRIKDWLLNAYFSHTDITSSGFLKQCEEFLETMDMNALKIHAPFLFNETLSHSELVERWNDIWCCTVGNDIMKVALNDISQDLKHHFDRHYWERMKAFTVCSQDSSETR